MSIANILFPEKFSLFCFITNFIGFGFFFLLPWLMITARNNFVFNLVFDYFLPSKKHSLEQQEKAAMWFGLPIMIVCFAGYYYLLYNNGEKTNNIATIYI